MSVDPERKGDQVGGSRTHRGRAYRHNIRGAWRRRGARSSRRGERRTRAASRLVPRSGAPPPRRTERRSSRRSARRRARRDGAGRRHLGRRLLRRSQTARGASRRRDRRGRGVSLAAPASPRGRRARRSSGAARDARRRSWRPRRSAPRSSPLSPLRAAASRSTPCAPRRCSRCFSSSERRASAAFGACSPARSSAASAINAGVAVLESRGSVPSLPARDVREPPGHGSVRRQRRLPRHRARLRERARARHRARASRSPNADPARGRALPLFAAALVVNQNLTALTALLVGAAVLLALRFRSRAILPMVAAAVLVAGAVAAYPPLRARASELGRAARAGDWDTVLSFRGGPWAAAIEMARERPLLGYGPGTFAAEYVPHRLAAEIRAQAAIPDSAADQLLRRGAQRLPAALQRRGRLRERSARSAPPARSSSRSGGARRANAFRRRSS